LHIPVGVRHSGEIASPDCYQARNDESGYSLAMTPLSVIAMAQPEAISSLLKFVIAILPFLRSDEAIAPDFDGFYL
jgi:hypothetical protein